LGIRPAVDAAVSAEHGNPEPDGRNAIVPVARPARELPLTGTADLPLGIALEFAVVNRAIATGRPAVPMKTDTSAAKEFDDHERGDGIRNNFSIGRGLTEANRHGDRAIGVISCRRSEEAVHITLQLYRLTDSALIAPV
jgi:hypothetical protein